MNEFEQKFEAMLQDRKKQLDLSSREFAESRFEDASNEVVDSMSRLGALTELLTAIEFAGPQVTTEQIIQAIKGRIEYQAARRLVNEKECNYISEKLAAFKGEKNEQDTDDI